MSSRSVLNIGLWLCLFLGASTDQVWGQTIDSVRNVSVDSVAMLAFLTAEGPAEAVFSFFSPPPYQFKSGVYTIGNPAFPLLNSPDSLVQFPIGRAHKQRRRARISAIATALPLAVLAYSATRVVLGLGALATGWSTPLGLPSSDVIRVSGGMAVAGIFITGTFNIASTINLRKGLRRHNSLFGRKLPTLFNPKGI